jgi:hypothetical protein
VPAVSRKSTTPASTALGTKRVLSCSTAGR